MAKKLVPRAKRVYWVDKPEKGEQLLIFDGGYYGGDIHVYEYKESFSSKVAKAEVEKKRGKEIEESQIPEVVRMWVEQRFGHSVSLDIK